jgi:hypothetical protein
MEIPNSDESKDDFGLCTLFDLGEEEEEDPLNSQDYVVDVYQGGELVATHKRKIS